METLRIGPGVPQPARRRDYSTLAALGRGLVKGTVIGIGFTIGTLIGNLFL